MVTPLILQQMFADGRARSVEDLLTQLPETTWPELRVVVWRLIDRGELDLTVDWKLCVPSGTPTLCHSSQ